MVRVGQVYERLIGFSEFRGNFKVTSVKADGFAELQHIESKKSKYTLTCYLEDKGMYRFVAHSTSDILTSW